jgi:hypothetical protein
VLVRGAAGRAPGAPLAGRRTDDLAVSLGVPTPLLPDPVFDPVRDLLVRLAVRRHSQSAVISALTRRERAGSIAAF